MIMKIIVSCSWIDINTRKNTRTQIRMYANVMFVCRGVADNCWWLFNIIFTFF